MEWEYFTHSIDIGGVFSTGEINAPEVTRILNWYGGQGWELVNTFGTAYNNGGTRHIAFIFKRPKPQAGSVPPVAT